MFASIFASISYASAMLADKAALSKFKIPIKRFLPLQFVFLALITSLFVFVRAESIMNSGFNIHSLGLFALMIAVGALWNLLYVEGIKKESLHEFELIMLLSPLVTVIFAAIFLPEERSLGVLIPGTIAALMLIFSRFKKHHLILAKSSLKSVLAMLLMSFELILIRQLLVVFTPSGLYLLRTGIIALLFIFLLKPDFKKISSGAMILTVICALFGALQSILKFYGFDMIGVVETTMILLFGPFIVYIVSGLILKEKIRPKDIIAVVVIALCVIYVSLFK